MKLIESINSPEDLRKIPIDQLPKVAEEIRNVMIENVSQSGGHLASSLGAVDLTIALHYVFNTPVDKLVWDVGHQAYAHKILTNRRDTFNTLRQFNGISGFPRISESPYDTVSVGHASTSISAALGIAMGRDLKKENHAVVAIIGDGSLSGGLAFEGLNNLGAAQTKMVVIVNDNKMSISKNVGALSRYLTRVLTDKRYNKLKDEVWELTGKLNSFGKRIRSLMRSIDETVKHFVIPGKLFEDMGLRYLGPIDGHNIKELVEILKFVNKSTDGPVLVHVITTKGKGYSFAENDSTKFHGVSKFSIDTGDVVKMAKSKQNYSDVFGTTLVDIARTRTDVVAITAAMPDGTGLAKFRDEFPNRFFDVGIAEQHAITFAAGLALKGIKPVVAMYSTFLQRGYDQLMHDIALDNLNVVFCIDRAGIVGEDGPTHHGMFDLSFVRTVPNALMMAPRNGTELVRMLHTAMTYTKGPVFIRYGRGGIPEDSIGADTSALTLYEPEIVVQGNKAAIIAIGDMVSQAIAASEILKEKGFSPTIINARFIKPLSKNFYQDLFSSYSHIITMESNSTTGGFGSGVVECANALSLANVPRFLQIGYPDDFIEHGNNIELLKKIHLDSPSVAQRIADFVTGP